MPDYNTAGIFSLKDLSSLSLSHGSILDLLFLLDPSFSWTSFSLPWTLSSLSLSHEPILSLSWTHLLFLMDLRSMRILCSPIHYTLIVVFQTPVGMEERSMAETSSKPQVMRRNIRGYANPLILYGCLLSTLSCAFTIGGRHSVQAGWVSQLYLHPQLLVLLHIQLSGTPAKQPSFP